MDIRLFIYINELGTKNVSKMRAYCWLSLIKTNCKQPQKDATKTKKQVDHSLNCLSLIDLFLYLIQLRLQWSVGKLNLMRIIFLPEDKDIVWIFSLFFIQNVLLPCILNQINILYLCILHKVEFLGFIIDLIVFLAIYVEHKNSSKPQPSHLY